MSNVVFMQTSGRKPPFDHLPQTEFVDAVRGHFDMDQDVSTMSSGQKWNVLIRLTRGAEKIGKDKDEYDIDPKIRDRIFEVLTSMEWDEVVPAVHMIAHIVGLSFYVFRDCPGWMDFAQTYRHYLRCTV